MPKRVPLPRLIKIGSGNKPRCAGCGRTIKKEGYEHNGKLYGPECVRRQIERDNSGEGTVVQERFL